MDKDAEIREYETKDQTELRRFYADMENQKRTSRVLHALGQRSSAKFCWQAGLVGIVGIHLSQYSIKHTLLLMAELLLWSAGVSLFWFKRISQEYDAELDRTCQHMVDELAAIRDSEKSNAWIMMNSKQQGQIIGTVAFKYESGEGKIGYLTGIDPQICSLLLKHALRFGPTVNIDVVSKSKDGMKWSESDL